MVWFISARRLIIIKRSLKAVSVVIILLLFLFLISIPFVNDYAATLVVDKLKDIPLPEKTFHVESISQAGKLTGNGNGMQFFGAILLESELSIDELKRFYSDYSNSELSLIIKEQASRQIGFIEHSKLSFKQELTKNTNYFILYSWGCGIEPFSFLDIRGH